jgi:hypothetical protein
VGYKKIRKGALQDDNADALIGLEFSAEFVEFLGQNFIKKIYRRVIDADECDSRIEPEPETFVIRISHASGSISVSRFSVVPHRVGQDPEPLNLHFEDIAGLHENGRFTRRSDATRRAGDDHITSLQTYRDADHFNQRCDAEDELVCACILHHTAIQTALDAQSSSAWRNGIGHYQPRAERSCAIEILANCPLRCA